MSAMRFDTAIVASMMEGAIEFCAKKTGLKDRKQILRQEMRSYFI